LKTLSLIKSLGINNGDSGFQKELFSCMSELFGYSRDEFDARWRPRNSSDVGTLRRYAQPTSDALFDEWKAKRDPSWLYSHPEYKWDSVGVSYCQTKDTTVGGVKLLTKAGISPKLAFDWGAGPGFSSFILARNFPDIEVHYNECSEDLISIFEWFKKRFSIKNVKHVATPCETYDLIQAYEIAEHLEHTEKRAVGDPFTELDKLLCNMQVGSHVLHSSCWSAEKKFTTLGHFLSYEIDGETFKNVRTNGVFRKAMVKRGWSILGSGWNSRPYLYEKNDGKL